LGDGLTRVTEEQYLAIDRAAEFRSEFLDGEMIAMSGGSMRHAQLQANVIGELFAALRGSDCRVYSSDFRVRVSRTRMYAYPDALVVCGKPLLSKTLREPPSVGERAGAVKGCRAGRANLSKVGVYETTNLKGNTHPWNEYPAFSVRF
jgi:Putative restriction endonuclease